MKTKEWLKEQRKIYKLSQSQLCELANLNLQTLQQIEQGRRNGSEETWKKIETCFSLLKNDSRTIKDGFVYTFAYENNIYFYDEKNDIYASISDYDKQLKDVPENASIIRKKKSKEELNIRKEQIIEEIKRYNKISPYFSKEDIEHRQRLYYELNAIELELTKK